MHGMQTGIGGFIPLCLLLRSPCTLVQRQKEWSGNHDKMCANIQGGNLNRVSDRVMTMMKEEVHQVPMLQEWHEAKRKGEIFQLHGHGFELNST